MSLDGAYGVGGNDFPHEDETFFIGVDQTAAEINRSMTMTEMVWPRLYEEYTSMIDSGYHGFEKWDGIMKKKVGVRHPNYIMLRIFTFLKLLQNILYYKWYLWYWVFLVLNFQFIGGIVSIYVFVSFILLFIVKSFILFKKIVIASILC